jgi:hypothetical protein
MFDKWLIFFYSKQDIINKYKIKKEFLENGELKISGKEPDEWSIIIKPEKSRSIYDIIYEKEDIKKNALSSIKIGLINKDKKLFEEGLSLYEKSLKDIEKLNKEFNKNDDVIKKLDNDIFEFKRKMYYEKDINNVLSLSKKVMELRNKKENSIKEFNNNLENYEVSSKALIKKGPVPEVPSLKTETYKLIKKKFKFDTTSINNISTNEKNNSDEYQQGGFIKVVKL